MMALKHYGNAHYSYQPHHKYIQVQQPKTAYFLGDIENRQYGVVEGEHQQQKQEKELGEVFMWRHKFGHKLMFDKCQI
jgi:hypothetical protein